MCYLKKKTEAGSNKSESEDSIYVPFACEDCKCGDQPPALQEIEDMQNLSISSTPIRTERPGVSVSERATTRPRRAAPSVVKAEDQNQDSSPELGVSPFLGHRKWEGSVNPSAFDEVQKKRKVAYDEGPGPDTFFRPVATHSPMFMDAINYGAQRRGESTPPPPTMMIAAPASHEYAVQPKRAIRAPAPAAAVSSDLTHDFMTQQKEMLETMHTETKQGFFGLQSMLMRTNQFMREMLEKQQRLEIRIDRLTVQNDALKLELEEKTKPKKQTAVVSDTPLATQPGKTFVSNPAELLEALFPRGQIQDFAYFLVQDKELNLPIYRQRNFGFSLKLTDASGNMVTNSNLLMLNVSLYTTSNPPRKLEMNTGGFNILKQSADYELSGGSAVLEKLQIREVSSHYPNGWLFMVVQVRLDNPTCSKAKVVGGSRVDAALIQPFILPRLVVKAKRMK